MSKQTFKGAIRGFKLTPKGGVQYSYVNHRMIGGEVDNVVANLTDPREPHLKLKQAIRGLLSHAMLIFLYDKRGKKIDEQYINTKQVINDPDFMSYEVFGLTLKGDAEGESVTLRLRKEMLNGRKGEIKLPSVKLYNTDEYTYSGNLQTEVNEVFEELVKYINSGFDEDLQHELFGELVDEESDY